MRATSPRAAPAHGLVPGSVNSHCCWRLTGRGQRAVPSGPKVLELQQGVPGAEGGEGAQLVGFQPPSPSHAHSSRAPGLHPSDVFSLHLRLQLNKGSVAKKSLKITGLVHHSDSADEQTDSEQLGVGYGELGLYEPSLTLHPGLAMLIGPGCCLLGPQFSQV